MRRKNADERGVRENRSKDGGWHEPVGVLSVLDCVSYESVNRVSALPSVEVDMNMPVQRRMDIRAARDICTKRSMCGDHSEYGNR
jgi:hypothetical protein